MAEPLQVALIGYGLAGRVFHAPLIRAEPGLRLRTIVTADPERSAQARADNPHTAVVAGVQQLWETAVEHDLVVVASPNAFHAEQAAAALELGLHTVVDKPLAPDADTAAQLAELARRRGRQLHVFHNRRWDSDFRTLRALVADGRLGRVHRLESRFERWRPQRKGGWRESSDPAVFGGLLLDLGSHLVDQALVLLGAVDSVYAEMARLRDPGGAEDDVFLALRHRGGAISHLWAGALAAAPGPRFRVLGDRGAFVVAGLDGQEEQLRAGVQPGPAWGAEPPEHWGVLYPDGRREPALAGAWPQYYSQIVASVRDDGPAPVKVEDAVAGLRILDAARVSAATGTIVRL